MSAPRLPFESANFLSRLLSATPEGVAKRIPVPVTKKTIGGQTEKLQAASHYGRYALAASSVNCLATRTWRARCMGVRQYQISIHLICASK